MKKDRNHILIAISGLKDGEYDFHFTVKPEDLTLPDNFREKIEIDIQIEKLKLRYLSSVHAETRAQFECDRCLEPVEIPINAEFTILCTSDVNEAKQYDEEEDVKIVATNEHEIDFTDEIRQYTLLSIPIRRTCGEDADGVSLCKRDIPAERMIPIPDFDPRWEELKKLDLKT